MLVWPLHIRQVQIVFSPGFYRTMDPQDSKQVPGWGWALWEGTLTSSPSTVHLV